MREVQRERVPQLKDCKNHFDAKQEKGKGTMVFICGGQSGLSQQPQTKLEYRQPSIFLILVNEADYEQAVSLHYEALYAFGYSLAGNAVSLRAKPARELRVRIGHF